MQMLQSGSASCSHSCSLRQRSRYPILALSRCQPGSLGRSSKAPRTRRRPLAVLATAEEELFRNQVKNLTRLYYASATERYDPSSGSTKRKPRLLKGSVLRQVPLWRVEWAVLPGMQEILHVLAPHYVHLFESLFSGPRPWLFGHLYLPGGSKSLGAASHALASGSKAPLVGVLMQVTRGVRLRDGKFLLLATALTRFKVCGCLRELPYSEADVLLYEDCEVLEGLGQQATAAALQAAPDDVALSTLMSVSGAAAREAAAALQWSWLRGYELQVAAAQEWPGPGPHEGENDMETYHLVQELAAQGVADVLPLPDGVVIGRSDLQQVSEDAAAAVQQALTEAAARISSGSSGGSSSSDNSDTSSSSVDGAPSSTSSDTTSSSSSSDTSSSSSSGILGSSMLGQWGSAGGESSSSITSLNTVAERGVVLQAPELQQLARCSSCGSLEEVLLLEAAVWQQLDVLAALSSRVKGRRQSLPFGLLQLRPPRPTVSVAASTLLANQAAAAAAAAGGGEQQQSSSSSDGSGSGSRSSSGESTAQASAAQQAVPDAQPAGGKLEVGSSTESSNSITGSSIHSSNTDAAALPGSNSSSTSSSSSSPSVPLTDSSSSSPSSGISSRGQIDPQQQQQLSSSVKYAFAASEGTDVHAHPLWPPLRRAARLSWAAAVVTGEFDLDKGPASSELRQALLEAPSIAARLQYVLAVLQKHAKVLAALAAVKEVQE